MNDLEDFTYREVARHVRPRSKRNPTLYINVMIHGVRHRKCLHTRDKRIGVLRALDYFEKLANKGRGGKNISDLLGAIVQAKRATATEGRLDEFRRALNRLVDAIGDIDISDVSPEHVTRFISELHRTEGGPDSALQRRLGGRTINNRVEAVRTAFNFAVSQKWITTNHFSGAKKAVEEENAPVVYLPDELNRIILELYKMEGDFGPTAEIFLYTAMRPKEGTKVTFDDIDFEHKTLTIRAETTKKKRYKIIPLNDRCVEIFEYRRSRYDRPIPQSSLQIQVAWRKVRRKLGFKGRFYDLRKTSNTWLKYYGHLESSICKLLLGHRNANDSNEMYYTGFIQQPIFEAMQLLTTTLFPNGAPSLPKPDEKSETPENER